MVRFDFYGSGESEGEFSEATFTSEVEDLGSMLDYVSERPDVDHGRIGVLGLSMGGAVSIVRASRDPRIRFVCTWSAPGNFMLLSRHAEEIIAPSRLVGEYLDLPSGFRVSVKMFQELLNLSLIHI